MCIISACIKIGNIWFGHKVVLFGKIEEKLFYIIGIYIVGQIDNIVFFSVRRCWYHVPISFLFYLI